MTERDKENRAGKHPERGRAAPNPEEVTVLLRQVGAGSDGAIEELFALVYDELRRIAGKHFQNQPTNHTLQPTALIHEAYLRLIEASSVETRDRSHFFALASRVMRQLLVDHCRRRTAAKRGGDWGRVTLDGVGGEDATDALEVLDLDEALERLRELDERKSRVVELRFFGGLEMAEVATVLDVSTRTAESDWAFARAWLRKEIAGRSAEEE